MYLPVHWCMTSDNTGVSTKRGVVKATRRNGEAHNQFGEKGLRYISFFFVITSVFLLVLIVYVFVMFVLEYILRDSVCLLWQSLQDVTAAEFKMFVEFLKSMNLFGPSAPIERMQELVEIIAGQADLDVEFDVSFSSCFHVMLVVVFHYEIGHYRQ